MNKKNKKASENKKILAGILFGVLFITLIALIIFLLVEKNGTKGVPLLGKAAYDGSNGGFSDTFRSGGYYLMNSNKLNKNVELSDINPKYYTFINVCFFAIDPKSCKLVYIQEGKPISDWYIKNVVKNEKITVPGIPQSDVNDRITINLFTYLQNQVKVEWPKKWPNAKTWPKILLSVGGWDIANHWKLGQMFNILANDAVGSSTDFQGSFTSFTDSIKNLIDKYSFIDGIDIDWEYPGRPPFIPVCKNCGGDTTDQNTFACAFGGPDSGFGACDSQGGPYKTTRLIGADPNSVYNGWSAAMSDFNRTPPNKNGSGFFCGADPGCKGSSQTHPNNECGIQFTDTNKKLGDMNIGFPVPVQEYGPSNLLIREGYKNYVWPTTPTGSTDLSENTLMSCGTPMCDTGYPVPLGVTSSQCSPSLHPKANKCPFMQGPFYYPQLHGGAGGSAKDSSNFVVFIKGLRQVLPNKLLTYTIGCAPWGLHWYVDAIYALDGEQSTSDFINLMSYDYAGWWHSGYVSGWLANIYTDSNLSACVGNTNKEGQYYVQPPESCDPRANLFAEKEKTPAGCPFTYMNTVSMNNPWSKSGNLKACNGIGPENTPTLEQIKYSGCNPNSLQIFNTMNTLTTVYGGKNVKKDAPGPFARTVGLLSPSIFSDQDPSRPRPTSPEEAKAGGGLWAPKNYAQELSSNATVPDQQMRITLSIQTMVNLLTGPMKIPKSKLNLGLAYYGRNFQQDPSSSRNNTGAGRQWQKGSKGIFQFFDRGTALDFNLIYSHYGSKQFQHYNMKGNSAQYPEATEPFISNEKFTGSYRNLCGPQSKPINEFISFYDQAAIKARTQWAKKEKFGGVFCWHILGDYIEGSTIYKTMETIAIVLGSFLVLLLLALAINQRLKKKHKKKSKI